tara:strand:- start:2382 stop:2723 length:342 start_codon:yes stop_codon:yes gene_type:complete
MSLTKDSIDSEKQRAVMDPRVLAVRNDTGLAPEPVTFDYGTNGSRTVWTMDHPIGRGSCSYIDECFTDEEVLEKIEQGVDFLLPDGSELGSLNTPKKAVDGMRKLACFLHNGE